MSDRSHAGSHTDERLPDSPDSGGQPTGTRPRRRTDLDERGCQYGNLRIRRSRAARAKPAGHPERVPWHVPHAKVQGGQPFETLIAMTLLQIKGF